MKLLSKLAMSATAFMMFAAIGSSNAEACTRVVYSGSDSLFIVGRSLDWKTPIPTNVYVYPRGMTKVGSDKPGAITWVSKYGAAYAVGYDAGVTEGMNEKGLSVNGLFCKGTVYNTSATDKRPPISLAMFPAWLLDQCATVGEVRDLLSGQNFYLYGSTFDGGTASVLHWEVTDATGASIIVEFTDGVMNIYDVDIQKYPCMTNDPIWPKMTAIVDYWEKIGGQNMLPGSVSSPDRCVRGNYFAKHVNAVADADEGAAICRTVLNTCCVPYTYNTSTTGEPNVSMTQWRSFSNLRDLRYYFQPAEASGFWYIDLGKIDLRKGSPVYKMVVKDMLNAVGDQNKALHKSAPFTPMF